MRIDLVTLRLFVAAVEQQSIAKAAEREHIAASAVSKRLSDLEETLKVELFQRHSKGLEPTPAGHALLHHARVVLRDLAQLESELADFAQGSRGNVRIFANISALVQFLPEDLSGFLARHPDVKIDLQEGISPAILRAVAEGQADIGIFGGNLRAPGLQILPYRRDRLLAVLPEGHALARHATLRLAQMLPFDFVGLQKGSSIDTLLMAAAEEAGHPAKLRIRVSGFEAACRMVEADLGIALVPERVLRGPVAAMRILARPLDEDWSWRRIDLCIRDTATLPPAARLLLDHLTRAETAEA